MRLYTDKALTKSAEKATEMIRKLAAYQPDEKLDRDDIRTLMFICREYIDELHCIAFERTKAARKAR